MNCPDIAIIGAGVPGIALALQLARAKINVVLVDRAPDPCQQQQNSDRRTTALLAGPKQYLGTLNAWDESQAYPLTSLVFVDENQTANPLLRFNAHDHGLTALAWNVETLLLRQTLAKQAKVQKHLALYFDTDVAIIDVQGETPRLELDNDEILLPKLVIGADGPLSAIRESAGIPLNPLFSRDANTQALTGIVTHSQPLNNCSYEFQRAGGPLTLIPCGLNEQGQARTAFVWSELCAVSTTLDALHDKAFLARLASATRGIMGSLARIERRGRFPIRPQLASQLFKGRVALMAEAAHVYPPSGAQGMNTSLADAAVLGQLLTRIPQGRDFAEVLPEYQKWRTPDILARYAATRGLGFITRLDDPLGQRLRQYGFARLRHSKTLQNMFVSFGRRPLGAMPETFC